MICTPAIPPDPPGVLELQFGNCKNSWSSQLDCVPLALQEQFSVRRDVFETAELRPERAGAQTWRVPGGGHRWACWFLVGLCVCSVYWRCCRCRRAGVDQRARAELGPGHRTEGVRGQSSGERRSRSAPGFGRVLRPHCLGTAAADPYTVHTGERPPVRPETAQDSLIIL